MGGRERGRKVKKERLMPLFPYCYHFASNVIGKVIFKLFSGLMPNMPILLILQDIRILLL